MPLHDNVDVLVIGSGAAGLALALRLPQSLSVALISKDTVNAGSTWYAQGGISAVLHPEDSFSDHAQDTIIAGAGLCHANVVDFTVRQGPAMIRWLTDLGMEFSRKDQDWHLTNEGGHSHRRVIHCADATGKMLGDCLADQARRRPNIRVLEQRCAVDLIIDKTTDPQRCTGAYLFNSRLDQVESLSARAIVLATGGASKAWLYTSNPDGSSGDGIAMAWRAGCRVANMEFNQFHPTCLHHPHAKSFLISEALRGEGAILRLPDGEAFMARFDPRAELAPRDIVARAIDHEIKRLGCECVYLDISHRPAAFIEQHFPTILQRCLEFGFDIRTTPIPVVPAAHYTCGGILTDLQGQTDIDQLFAIGECAWTGLHGANRLASNSLLECLVFGHAAAEAIARTIADIPPPPAQPAWDESQVTDSDEDVVISHNWDELRRTMRDYVGIVRTDKRLQRAARRIEMLQAEIHDYYANYKISANLIELRNLAQVADLIIRSAQTRRESRGLHYSLDWPKMLPEPHDTILGKENGKR